ncbi:MAG: hypothetical protein RL304_1181, partial [Verrucomicrobiota bacterium]
MRGMEGTRAGGLAGTRPPVAPERRAKGWATGPSPSPYRGHSRAEHAITSALRRRSRGTTRRNGGRLPRGEGDARGPAERADAGDIHELARGAVGHGRVELQATGEAGDPGRQFGEPADGDLLARADVDRAGLGVAVEEEEAGLGEVVRVQELAERRAGAPEAEDGVAAEPGLVHLADHRGQDVGLLEREIVAGPVQVARHRADEVAPMLGPGVVAELDARDLGDGIGLVGRLERAGQQGVLADRLRGVLRVDAARAEEEQLTDARPARAFDDVDRHRQVVVQEVVGLGGVGLDPADARGGHDDDVGPLGGEER